MTARPDIVRQNDLLNQLVLDRTTLEELGRVEMLWMYPQTHRVLGFICKSGFLGNKRKAFTLAQIEAFGANGILTHSQPDETDVAHVNQLESFIHCEVWSDEGRKIGKIVDCLFKLETGRITAYLLSTGRLAGITSDIYQLPPAKIFGFGRKRVLVTEEATKTLKIYQEGLQHKLVKASDFLKDDAAQELRSLTQQAQTVTEQAKEQFQHLTSQVKDRAQSLSKQAQETVKTFNAHVKEEADVLIEQVKETSYTVTEQFKQQTQAIGKQVEEGIQTLTVQAEEIFDPATTRDRETTADVEWIDEDSTDTGWIDEDNTELPTETHPATASETDAGWIDQDSIELPTQTHPTAASEADDPWLEEDRIDFPTEPNSAAASETDDPWLEEDVLKEDALEEDAEVLSTPSTDADPTAPSSSANNDSTPVTPVTGMENADRDDDEPWI